MSYSLATLWHDRQRYLPGMLAVAFSAVLIALQCGLLLGLLSVTSLPIDHTRADLWVGAADVLSIDIGGPITDAWVNRGAEPPDDGRDEEHCQGVNKGEKPKGGQVAE